MNTQILSHEVSSGIFETLKQYWHLFNKNYRETIKYLWALSQKHDFVFPTYERMAEICGYSVRTAKNICARLAELGIISWMRRGYRSNLYFLPDELVSLNLRNRQLFAKSSSESCTISCTVLNNIDSNEYVHRGEPSASPPPLADVPKNLEEEQQSELKKNFDKLPQALRLGFMREFDFKRGSWIVQQLSECHVSEILRDMLWYRKKKPVDNPCALFVSFALKKLGIRK